MKHIGVLTALRERGVKVSCVVGTSMGSLVGSLYAFAPERDVALAYREVFEEYEQLSRREVGPLGLGLLFGFNRSDWQRLRQTLRVNFQGARVESLPLRFVTEHQVITDSGVQRRVVRRGILADEVAASIANPVLFPDIEETKGTQIDPGADRVSAVPLETACREFPKHQFIVSNVTESPAFISKTTHCPYQELLHAPSGVDQRAAISGKDPDLTALVFSGFRAADEELIWANLPKGVPSVSPLYFRRLEVSARLPLLNTLGEAWDAFEGKPDPHLRVKIEGCEGCDFYGTSAGRVFEWAASDTFLVQFDLGIVAIRQGYRLNLSISDRDLAESDLMGEIDVALDEISGSKSMSQNEIEWSVTLSSASF